MFLFRRRRLKSVQIRVICGKTAPEAPKICANSRNLWQNRAGAVTLTFRKGTVSVVIRVPSAVIRVESHHVKIVSGKS